MNLDNAHDDLLAVHQLTRSEFEDSILYNDEQFGRWATRYMSSTGNIERFLSWCWRKYEAEHTPKHTEAWKGDE